MLTRATRTPRTRTRLLVAWGAVLMVALTVPAARLRAQLPLQPIGSPFEMVGFIQKATLNDPTDVFSGGTVTINNHLIVVPRNTILQMPATSMTWAEVFKFAPPPYGPTQSGLALQDVPKPANSFELFVQGNRIGNTYIAGLLFISQQSLQSHQGFINYIDYTAGEMRVGGTPGDGNTGARVRLNDPIGRFGRAMTADARFTIDEDNPTVRTETAYPMCLPRTDPAVEDDPLCPQVNRPKDPDTGKFLTIFTTPPVDTRLDTEPNANLMAPFEIGDYVTYSGLLINDDAGSYISAHQFIGNVGIFTAPGTLPTYVAIDVILMGTGPIVSIPLAQEGARRTRVEGFTTDPTAPVDIFAVDVDPCTGDQWDRYWATQGVDPGPPNGAVMGRWRFRPGAPLFDLKGLPFLPPTREVHAVSWNATWTGGSVTGNGLSSGQYQAPNFEFIFPENLGIGNPPIPGNFFDMQFLAQGSGPWFGGGRFKTALPQGMTTQLSPWPGAGIPSTAPCQDTPPPAPPTASAGANQTVPSGAEVTLDSAGSTGTNFLWEQIAGSPVTLSDATAAAPTFTAPVVPAGGRPAQLQFLLTTDDGSFAATATTTVTVNPALPPIANAGAAQTVSTGTLVTLSGTGTDPNVPPLGALTLGWAQAPGSTPAVVLTPTSGDGVSPATATFTAPAVPAGQASLVLTFFLTVGNGAPLAGGGTATATSATTVTILPTQPPVVSAGAAQTVASGAAVTLTGAVSDPNSPLLTDTSVWSQVIAAAQPAVSLTQGGTAAAPTAAFSALVVPAGGAPLTLTFRLTSTNAGGSASATVNVTINPAEPLTLDAGAPQSVDSGSTVTISGTVADPNVPALGAITSSWSTTAAGITLTQGGTPAARTATFTAPTIAAGQAAQTVAFTLTASNGAGTFAATTTVKVNPPPIVGQPPVVTAGANQTVNSNVLVALSSTVTDPNTTPAGTLTSAWSQVVNAGDPVVTLTNGGTAGSRTAAFTSPVIPAGGAARTLTFQLSGSNSAGTSTATTLVTVNPAQPLAVSAGPARTVSAGASVTLTGSASDPNVPAIGAFTSVWSTAAAGVTLTPSGTAAAPTVTFTAPTIPAGGTAQTLVFTLTATNAAGSFPSTVNVTVNPALPLTVNAGAAKTAPASSAVTLTGSVTDPNVPTLGVITSTWSTTTAGVTLTQGGTPAAPTVTFTTPATAQTMTFTLTASNGAGTLTATTTVTVTSVTPPPAGSLVAAYNFNEPAGTTAADSSGNSNAGAINGAAHVAGHTGNALSFNGTSNTVRVADSASLQLTTAVTIEAWVRPTTLAGARTIVLKQHPVGGLAWALYAIDAGPGPAGEMKINNVDRAVNGATALPLNTWSHVATTFDGATFKVFVNGVQAASVAAAGTLSATSLPMWIGGNQPFGEFFGGLVDDVRVYRVALTAAQIQLDMTTPVP